MSNQAHLPDSQGASTPSPVTTDVLLVGAGIMSATLGALLKTLEPGWTITLVERLKGPAMESSDPWNNAGTGHSALCELNYTPRESDGTVNPAKAIAINEQFQLSRQFWSYGVENGLLETPTSFINPVPHVSFVQGADNAKYLKARYEALASSPLFDGIEYLDDADEFARRLPLMAGGRDLSKPIALNWTQNGTDVNFGALTRQLIAQIQAKGVDVRYGQKVVKLDRESDGSWKAVVKNRSDGSKVNIRAKFVFVGAGGGALPLLQKSGIDEIKGFAGFPVGGQFLRARKVELADQHHAKVYGMAAVGAPPMSVPHLDTRVINGERSLLFGPYAGWTPKFLKSGSIFDLPRSIRVNNMGSMAGVGLTNVALTRYLITEVLKPKWKRFQALHDFYPEAVQADWEFIWAGQRVQSIKKKGRGGSLEFGTTIVAAADGSIAGLLGASPGASTSVNAMLDVLKRCFGSKFAGWQPKLKEMVPSYGTTLSENPSLLSDLRTYTDQTLKLDQPHEADTSEDA